MSAIFISHFFGHGSFSGLPVSFSISWSAFFTSAIFHRVFFSGLPYSGLPFSVAPDWIRMLFGVVSKDGRGMGVLDGAVIVEGEG